MVAQSKSKKKDDKRHECYECGKAFRDLQAAHSHVNVHHPNKLRKPQWKARCPMASKCNVSFNGSLLEHFRSTPGVYLSTITFRQHLGHHVGRDITPETKKYLVDEARKSLAKVIPADLVGPRRMGRPTVDVIKIDDDGEQQQTHSPPRLRRRAATRSQSRAQSRASAAQHGRALEAPVPCSGAPPDMNNFQESSAPIPPHKSHATGAHIAEDHLAVPVPGPLHQAPSVDLNAAFTTPPRTMHEGSSPPRSLQAAPPSPPPPDTAQPPAPRPRARPRCGPLHVQSVATPSSLPAAGNPVSQATSHNEREYTRYPRSRRHERPRKEQLAENAYSHEQKHDRQIPSERPVESHHVSTSPRGQQAEHRQPSLSHAIPVPQSQRANFASPPRRRGAPAGDLTQELLELDRNDLLSVSAAAPHETPLKELMSIVGRDDVDEQRSIAPSSRPAAPPALRGKAITSRARVPAPSDVLSASLMRFGSMSNLSRELRHQPHFRDCDVSQIDVKSSTDKEAYHNLLAASVVDTICRSQQSVAEEQQKLFTTQNRFTQVLMSRSSTSEKIARLRQILGELNPQSSFLRRSASESDLHSLNSSRSSLANLSLLHSDSSGTSSVAS